MPDIHGTREELVELIVRLTAENEKLRGALREIEIKGGTTGYGRTALRILARRALNDEQ